LNARPRSKRRSEGRRHPVGADEGSGISSRPEGRRPRGRRDERHVAGGEGRGIPRRARSERAAGQAPAPRLGGQQELADRRFRDDPEGPKSPSCRRRELLPTTPCPASRSASGFTTPRRSLWRKVRIMQPRIVSPYQHRRGLQKTAAPQKLPAEARALRRGSSGSSKGSSRLDKLQPTDPRSTYKDATEIVDQHTANGVLSKPNKLGGRLVLSIMAPGPCRCAVCPASRSRPTGGTHRVRQDAVHWVCLPRR
jgi:hypothetical protein